MKKWLGIVTMGAVVALAGCHKNDDSQAKSTDAAASSSADAKPAAVNKAAASMTDQEKVSYALGVMLAGDMKTRVPDIQLSSFSAGLHEAYDGHPAMSLEDSQAAIQAYQKKRIEDFQAKQKTLADKNLKDGDAYAADYAKKEGVKKTASGLMYRVLTVGAAKGPQPSDASEVEVNYEGRHLDGSVFDSSYERKEPVSFRVGDVIPGWKEALKLMHIGDEWEVVIPAAEAYGPAGLGEGGPIGPNETLIFKIKLLQIDPNTKH